MNVYATQSINFTAFIDIKSI